MLFSLWLNHNNLFCNISYSHANKKKVSCGAWKLDGIDTNEQSYEVIEILNHPEYNFLTNANDIAVLKVNGTFICDQTKIWPACIPSEKVR